MAVVSGGTTLIDNGALDAGVPSGSLILLSTQTASASASIEFTSGIDSTYDSYIFKFIDIHPSVDDAGFAFQGSINGGSSYGITITSTNFNAFHNEADTSTGLNYNPSSDLAQSTSLQILGGYNGTGNDNDQSLSGQLQIFNPSSTTYVKHFIATTQFVIGIDYSKNDFTAGYFNDGANDINAFKFQFETGNIDDGIIKMYGVK